MSTPPPLPRVRVTAPRQSRPRPAPTASSGGDLDRLYVRSLIRSQLRLGLASAAGFAVVLVGLPLALLLWPELGSANLLGLPLPWLLLGAGLYPVAIGIAALYVRGAARNEARYRSLAEDA